MLGVRLDTELEERLAAVARTQGRSKSDIAREAVRRYVDLHDEAYRREAARQSAETPDEEPAVEQQPESGGEPGEEPPG